MHINKNQFGKIDIWVFTILTGLSLGFGKLTVFYLMYLFWWDEFVRKLVGFFYYKKHSINDRKVHASDFFGSFFLLGIYLVFIVVIFMLIANWGNNDLVFQNFKTFLFKNWFFNVNIIWFFIENIMLHRSDKNTEIDLSPFSSSAIILHISIILGAFIMFLVVKRYNDFFTPDNHFGSFLIAVPFLALKMLFKK
jgi:hypothetical protein